MREMSVYNPIHKPQRGVDFRPLRRKMAAAGAALLLLGGLAFCTPFSARASEIPPSMIIEDTSGETPGAVPETAGESAPPVASGGGAAAATDAATAKGAAGEEAQPSSDPSSPLTMEVQYGYDNTAKGGRYLPLRVTIGNNRRAALDGRLSIKSMESDGTVYRYDYDVDMAANSALETRYYIPLGTNAGQLVLTLSDASGSELLSRKVKLNISQDVPELFIGVLSDEPDQLQYLNGVGIRYSTLRTRAFPLGAADFPEEETGLSLLDVLVVNNYKLRNLSEKQTAAIMDWVHNGGLLILGTGERVDDTLGRFAPELLDDSYGTASLRHIDLGEEYSLDQPDEGMLAISCVDVPLHGGNVVISSGGFPLLTAAAKSQGMIAVAAFDMGDISDFCREQPGYVDHMFTSLLGETRINHLAEVVYSGNSDKFWSVQSLINTGNVDKLPNLYLYVGIVLVYLGLLGPGLYLFLKNRELQIYYRRSVLALSLLFAGVIYLMGSTTRFKSTFFTYATIRDVTADYTIDTTYVNIRNPYNRPYQVELTPGYSVLPITRSYLGNNPAPTSFSAEDPYQVAISRQDGRLTIRGQNIAAFAPRYFKMECKNENVKKEGIVGEVDYFVGRLSGSLTNEFSFPIENTALILYGNMVLIGRMEPGETKNLEDYSLLRFPLGDSYVVADRISGENEFYRTDINDKSYLLAMERSNLLKFYLDNYLNSYSADARVIAFSTEKENREFLQSPTAETYGLTMLTASVAVNASRDMSLYRSVLMKAPQVVSGTYDESTNSMKSADPLTLEYQLGTDISVESLTFEPVSEEFVQAGSSYTDAFSGNVYFYNYGSGNYDQVEAIGRTMTVEELKSYLSPDNTLTVRYVYDGMGGYGAIQLPMPMAAGRER